MSPKMNIFKIKSSPIFLHDTTGIRLTKWLASRNGRFHIVVNNPFLNTNLGGFVVTIGNKSLLAILPVERWLTRTNLSCINLIVYLKFSAQQNL